MKTLTEYISNIVSPFDEGVIDDQVLLNRNGYQEYSQDLLINSIYKKENEYNTLIFFDDIYNSLNQQKKRIFLDKILKMIIKRYLLNYLQFYNEIKDVSLNKQEEIIDLFRFLETDQYHEFLSKILPSVPLECNQNLDYVKKFVNDSVFVINEQIKKTSIEYPNLLKIFFKYGDIRDFIGFFILLLNKDVLSIIVKQKEVKNDNN